MCDLINHFSFIAPKCWSTEVNMVARNVQQYAGQGHFKMTKMAAQEFLN